MRNKKPLPSISDDRFWDILRQIVREHIRHARWTSGIFYFAASASILVSLVGCVVLLFGNATQGTVTTAIGLVSTNLSSQFAQEASVTLDQLIIDLKKVLNQTTDEY
jgi:hypothetical protein